MAVQNSHAGKLIYFSSAFASLIFIIRTHSHSVMTLPPWFTRFALNFRIPRPGAPSAANFQFWRFKVEPDQKTIYVSIPEGYKHPKWEHPIVDIGITACHLWLGLSMKGIDCKVEVEEVKGCAVWKFSLK